MPSSTFSSSAAWALKLALTGTAVIVVASVADPPHLSLDERSVMTMATLNQLVLDRYVQGQTQKPIVFVGSSILTNIPPPNCRPDTVASIYLQGWGAQTGLAAIRRTGVTPRVVFVELTRAMIGPDPQILESAFTPFYYYPRRYFSALRQNRNLMTMLYRSFEPELSIQYELPQMTVSEWEEKISSVLSDQRRAFDNSASNQRGLPGLLRQIRELQRDGVRIILYDTSDAVYANVLPQSQWRALLKTELPDIEWFDPPPDLDIYRNDGLHLYQASGVQFFEYLMDRAGLPFERKCIVSGKAGPEDRAVQSKLLPAVELGHELNFRDGENRAALVSGWSVGETWGVWSDGRTARIAFIAKGQTGNATLRLVIRLRGYLPPPMTTQTVEVSINRRKAASLAVSINEPDNFDIPIILDKSEEDTPIIVELGLPNAISPREAQGLGDSRQLAVGLVSASLQPK
jgi:hypothetical protein